MSGAQAETVSTTPTLTSTYSRTDVHRGEIRTVPLSDTPRGEGGLVAKSSRQYPTHAILSETTHAVLALGVSCASRKTAHVDLITEYNRPDEHSVTLVDVEWDAHEEQVLLAEQFFNVE